MVGKNHRVCPVERAGGLDSKIRKWVQNPKKILKTYVRKGMVTLDLGCGPGFFALEMAEMVGESGKVIAADLQEGMLEKLKNKIQGTRIEKRIKLHKCKDEKIGITNKVDFVLAFYLFHELPDQVKIIKEIRSILKSDGIFYMVEPKYFHVSKQEFEEAVKKIIKTGFRIVERPRVFLSRAAVFQK